MEFKTLINEARIPVLGFGTWKIGGEKDGPDYSHDKESILAIKYAISLGMTHIATAEVYGQGHTEELIGEAINGFDRKKLFINSKVYKTNLKYDDVVGACIKSLKRLQTDYIDLYMIHAPNPNIPIQETMEALNFLVDERMVKYIGVSNFTAEQIKEAQKYSKNKIVANEIQYSLVTRKNAFISDVEKEILPYCQENGIVVITYRPLELGALAKPGFDVLDEVAKKYGKSQAQVALNWLISKKGVVTIPKAINPEHIKDNLGASGWKMDEEDLDKLDRLSLTHS